jgi:5-methylcytosine-specific restriction protein B
MEVEPYLEEYFFDQQDKVDAFRWASVRARLTP